MDLLHCIPVSILVLVDLAHEYNTNYAIYPHERCFNPCFSGSCSRITSTKNLCPWKSGFNPCFSGSCSRILDISRFFQALLSFNPCFSGSCSRIRGAIPTKNGFCDSFNPCFSGSCSRIYPQVEQSLLDGCFNPCFSGSCSRITQDPIISAKNDVFQSLF